MSIKRLNICISKHAHSQDLQGGWGGGRVRSKLDLFVNMPAFLTVCCVAHQGGK